MPLATGAGGTGKFVSACVHTAPTGALQLTFEEDSPWYIVWGGGDDAGGDDGTMEFLFPIVEIK